MNKVHSTAVIGSAVRLGDGNVVGPYAVIDGDVVIGSDNWIGAHAVIGANPEVRSAPHQAEARGAGVTIGTGVVIREAAQVHSGWTSRTVIGDGAFIMNQCYVAHDGLLAEEVTMASGVRLAGHVVVGRGANLGLGTVVHQGRVVGPLAMIGMGSVITRDIPPFAKAFGNPCRVIDVNVVGLRRAGVSEDDITAIISGGDSGHPPSSVSELVEWYAAVTR